MNMSSQNFYTNAYSGFTLIAKKLETTQISVNKWMDKQIVVYSYNAILFSNKGMNYWYT